MCTSWIRRGRVIITAESGAESTMIELDQQTLDAALFYLISSAHPMSTQGMGICGLSCTDYRNMQSWDTDWFMLVRPAVDALYRPYQFLWQIDFLQRI